MNITRGKISSAKKVVVYGAEGIGKSTFAAQFPDPVFIDTEGSTKDMDVARFEAPSSWTMLMQEVRYALDHPTCCKTLIIDTADWAEQLCIKGICDQYQKKGIEDFGYGKGYTYVKEEFGRLLNLLSDLVKRGINVVITAHAQMRKFEQPDEAGAYDRWELKLSKQTAPFLKEWADMLLFANYKTHVVKVEGKNKVQGGRRVMYTAHHSCWDAKNRYGLEEELPFEYESIRQLIESGSAEHPATDAPVSNVGAEPPAREPETIHTPSPAPTGSTPPPQSAKSVSKPETEKKAPQQSVPPDGEQMSLPLNKPEISVDPNIPKPLRELMIANDVDEWDIQNVVAARGYFTSDVPVAKYEEYAPGFIEGCLVAAWDQVYALIKEMREKQSIPFD